MVGAYVSTFSIFQMALAVVFGVLAYFLRRAGYPTVTLLLGFLLEADLEQYLRRRLSLSDGDPSNLLTSPDSLFSLVLAAGSFWFMVVRRPCTQPASRRKGRRRRARAPPPD